MFEHSLKNAYIGEVYEYSYDFRNKSTSQITADGWNIAANHIQLWANWISGNSSTEWKVKKTVNLLWAERCILKTNLYISWWSWQRWWISPWFANAQGSFRANWMGNWPWFWLQLNLVSWTAWSQFNETVALNWQYTSTLEVDLVNNKASVTLDGVWTITNNNPDLTTFLSEQFLSITVTYWNSWVQDIKVTIEY